MTRVFFVGAGPGDPQLITLRGAALLERCCAVFTFAPLDETFAGLIAGKPVYDPYDFAFGDLLKRLDELLQSGDVVFLQPGDLTFFSPFQALIEALGDRVEVVPGVGTANAASALLRRTLNLSGVCTRTVLVSTRVLAEAPGAPVLEDVAAPGVTLLIYMNHYPLEELVSRLRTGYGRNEPIAVAHRIGLSGQRLYLGTLDDIVDQTRDCALFDEKGRADLTLIIVGEALTAIPDESWWDDRRLHVRRHRSR
jgi:precorrin-4/cobalt-precorrin-4 C11-methyltransferase